MNFYPGIVNDPKVPEVLRKIESSSIPGAKQLIINFLSSNAQSSYDYWLEIFIMWKLMEDKRVNNLVYEPNKNNKTPDFRFNIDKICYDLEVKYIRPNAYVKEKLFEAKCENYLLNIQKPWYFNCHLRHKFQEYHIDQFISHLEENFKSNEFQSNIDYYFPPEKAYDYIVHFWFVENASGKPPISLGIIVGSMWGPDQRVIELRKRIKKKITKTKKKMVNTVGPLQSNLLLLQIENVYPMIGNSEVAILHRVFYDTGGLFYQENKENLGNIFPWLNGVIILKSGIGLSDQNVEGLFFPNPINIEFEKNHPILFNKIVNNQVGQSGEPSYH